MNSSYKGFSVPFRIDPDSGSVAGQTDSREKIKENLIHLLLTNVGERVMLRTYGSGVQQLIHDPNNDILQALVRRQIAGAIRKWEPRVKLTNIAIIKEEGTLFARLEYVEAGASETETLNLPLGLGGL